MGADESEKIEGEQAEQGTGEQDHQAAAGEQRDVVVQLEMPFAVEPRGHAEREAVVGWDSAKSRAYLQALQREIAANADQFADCTVRAVRLGEGVATNAPADELCTTVQLLKRSLNFAPDATMSARASACNISGASMPLLRRAGVGRLDFELLALDRADFGRLNHSDAIQDFHFIIDSFLHAYANKTLGLVLAYGFDAPDTRAFRRSMVELTRMPVAHLVLERWQGPRVQQASEELASAQLAEAHDVLGKAGFVEYAPLHFAKPGDEDRFWVAENGGGEVLSFGLGARTRFDGVLSTNTSDWDTYLQFSGDFTRITVGAEPLA